MNAEEEACEQIATEQQAMALTVKSAVPFGVARQVHDAQSAPKGKLLAVLDEPVDLGRLISKELVAEAFKPPAPDCRTRIRIGSIYVRLLGLVGKDRCAGPFLQPREIADVIDMPMGEQNRLHALGRNSKALEKTPDLTSLTDEAGVEEYGAPVFIHQNVADTHDAMNRVYPGGNPAFHG